jgi:hypothetical protein
MVLLMVVTVAYLPIVCLCLPGLLFTREIARSLLLLMLLPLVIGLALKARYGDLTARVKPVLDWISNVQSHLADSLDHQRTSTKFYKCSAPRNPCGLLFIALGLGLAGCSSGPNAVPNG